LALPYSQAWNVSRENGNTVARQTRHNRLLRIADRLAKVAAGSASADRAIHEAIRQAGPVLPYTTDEAAARTLLPPGFEWMATTYAAGWVYAPCRRSGLQPDRVPYPHHAQWGRTLPLLPDDARRLQQKRLPGRRRRPR
jgi:hypothetical protein